MSLLTKILQTYRLKWLSLCTYDSVHLNMHKLVAIRVSQYNNCLDVVHHVVEDGHSHTDLLTLMTDGRHLHIDEERQHSHILKSHAYITESLQSILITQFYVTNIFSAKIALKPTSYF